MHAIARHSRGAVTIKPLTKHCSMDLTYQAALPLPHLASARHRNRKPPASSPSFYYLPLSQGQQGHRKGNVQFGMAIRVCYR